MVPVTKQECCTMRLMKPQLMLDPVKPNPHTQALPHNLISDLAGPRKVDLLQP
jgi:hypothetical protein